MNTYNNLFTERENSKRLLNEYLSNSIVLPGNKNNQNKQKKTQNIRVEEDISTRINQNYMNERDNSHNEKSNKMNSAKRCSTSATQS